MAAVENTNGLSLGTGIEYSWTVLTLSESSGVPNGNYFYDFGTKLVYYKNSSGVTIKVFEEVGSGTPGIAQSIQSFDISNTTQQSAIGNEMYSVKVIPTVLREVTQMSFFVITAANQNVTLSIHDSAGTSLLGHGSTTANGLGVRSATLNTTVTLLANTEYYFSIWVGSSGGSANFASKPLYSDTALGVYQYSVTSSTSTLPMTPANNPVKCFWLSAY